MTDVYFVRHCQSQKGWRELDDLRPLTALGAADSEIVTRALHETPLNYCVCSPYLRSLGTIRGCAEDHGLEIHTDARLGERRGGPHNEEQDLVMRWADRNYHEEGGECLRSCMERNIAGLEGVLAAHSGAHILFGTHGTALSTILDHYDPDFGLEGFRRLYCWMPYIVHAVFDGTRFVSREDLLIVNRGY